MCECSKKINITSILGNGDYLLIKGKGLTFVGEGAKLAKGEKKVMLSGEKES
jgi:hypothetical protein